MQQTQHKTKNKMRCYLIDYFKNARNCYAAKKPSEATLEWQPGTYSQSPFMPYWTITANGSAWIVTQEGKAFKQ